MARNGRTSAVGRLTPAQVVDIRQRDADGYRPVEIADRHGIDSRYVKGIAEGSIRKDVKIDVPRWFPLCMDRDEFNLWKRTSMPRLDSWTERLRRPCDDCPLSYAADMRILGLCNGTPGDVAEDEEAA